MSAMLKQHIIDVPDFPKPGILFRDITPLLANAFADTITAMDRLLTARQWEDVDVIAGVESRGFVLAAALAQLRGKGFVPVRKKGKLPPPVVAVDYSLEYGSGVLEMQTGRGRLLLVDDVLATGGTLKGAADLCKKAGFDVCGLAVLLDLKLIPELRWQNLLTHAVITY
jgi:adenine phosphoribosyltransferase